MIRRYLKFRLGMKYKQIKPINFNHNSSINKLKRQYSSSKSIEFLSAGKRIINIDESSISCTDSRSREWWHIKQKNQETRNRRLSNVNVSFGISNYGEFFYTVNYGKTNSETFFIFLMKLIQKLSVDNIYWSQNTILLLDNASYHRS